MSENKVAVILLAEDDDGHATLVQRNLRRAGVMDDIVRVADGQEAVDFVFAQGSHAGKEQNTPLFMLFDINMPRMDGIQALKHIKLDARTKGIPVVMLTTTDDPREIERCYESRCSLYVTKPIEYDAFCEVIQRLGLFLQIVSVPK